MTATFAPAPARRATPPAPRTRRPSPQVDAAVYRRRRMVAAVLVAALLVLVGVVAQGVLAGPGGVPASASGVQPAPTRIVLTARPGDTMWSIARAHHGSIDFDAYLAALIARNGGASIQVGQSIVLP